MTNKDLKIWKLEREIEYMKKEFEVREEAIRVDYRGVQISSEVQIAKGEAENENLKARLEEAPAKVINDVLKALTVKIPTMNIESLSVSAEKK